jgi:hypothetical protein
MTIIKVNYFIEGVKSMKTNFLTKTKKFLTIFLSLALLLPMGVGVSSDFYCQDVLAEEQLLAGDMNGDQKVDIVDAFMILQFSVNHKQPNEQQQEYGDVNVSDSVDAIDAFMVLQYALRILIGKINQLLKS